MSREQLANDLNSHQLQLKEINIKLVLTPDDEECLSLKAQLEEAIVLINDILEKEGYNKPQPSLNQWRVNDPCLAPTNDGQYTEGKITQIVDEELCLISFADRNLPEVTQMEVLKPLVKTTIAPKCGVMTKKIHQKNKSDYIKKRQEQKAERQQNIEKISQKKANDWQNFASKAKSMTKKSIFATPDNYEGKVGVGTCNIGGKPMTEYAVQEKIEKKQKKEIYKPKN